MTPACILGRSVEPVTHLNQHIIPTLQVGSVLQTLAAFVATLSKPQAGMLIGPHRAYELHQKQVRLGCCFTLYAPQIDTH